MAKQPLSRHSKPTQAATQENQQAANSTAPLGDGGEAFPRPASVGPDYLTGEPATPVDPQKGMSLRDYFAAKAMLGELITSSSDATPESTDALIKAAQKAKRTPAQQIAFNAYQMADAMLAARKAVANE